MASVETSQPDNDGVLNRLQETLLAAIDKTGPNTIKFERIMNRLHNLKMHFEILSPKEKSEFSEKLKDSFEDTISSIENELAKQKLKNQMFHYSMIILVGLITLFALFGYKLYKSLMEKELKKQEKQKNNKKSKKLKQK